VTDLILVPTPTEMTLLSPRLRAGGKMTDWAFQLCGFGPIASAARAAAFRSASPSRLSEVDAPGSAAWSRDVSDVTELERSGVRYVGLHHEVVAATTVAVEGARAVVRARVDTSGYAVTGRGDREERPPSAGASVLVDLVRTDAGWRVSDLRADG